MKYQFTWFWALFVFAYNPIIFAQSNEKSISTRQDSLYIETVESKKGSLKLLHAEPLYIDLIRDLGARKGEKEWNVGFGITDNEQYDEYLALVEYEWAPLDRLGLEIELPFTIYPSNTNGRSPASKLNGLKMAAQYTFLVSEKFKTSLAIGYIHEFEMSPFREMESQPIFTGNLYNPFFVAAKRWGQNFHTLIYTGPEISQNFRNLETHVSWQINSNFHYMIPGTRNFIGIELNKDVAQSDFDMIIRPQMRVELTKQILVGIVTGIPVSRENQRFSTFLRLIYEPKH
jgi:hypothetical protein